MPSILFIPLLIITGVADIFSVFSLFPNSAIKLPRGFRFWSFAVTIVMSIWLSAYVSSESIVSKTQMATPYSVTRPDGSLTEYVIFNNQYGATINTDLLGITPKGSKIKITEFSPMRVGIIEVVDNPKIKLEVVAPQPGASHGTIHPVPGN